MSSEIIDIIFAIVNILSTKRQTGSFPGDMSPEIVARDRCYHKADLGFIFITKSKKTLNLLGDFYSTAPPQITPPQTIQAPPSPPPPLPLPHNPPPAVTHEHLLLL
nr:hypothetical protein [Tanacetum cinerariifolium]